MFEAHVFSSGSSGNVKDFADAVGELGQLQEHCTKVDESGRCYLVDGADLPEFERRANDYGCWVDWRN